MRLDITTHASRQMRRRRITEQEVLEVLGNYQLSVPGDTSRVCYVGTTNRGRRLQVCTDETLEENSDCVRIVTAYEKGLEDG